MEDLTKQEILSYFKVMRVLSELEVKVTDWEDNQVEIEEPDYIRRRLSDEEMAKRIRKLQIDYKYYVMGEHI